MSVRRISLIDHRRMLDEYPNRCEAITSAGFRCQLGYSITRKGRRICRHHNSPLFSHIRLVADDEPLHNDVTLPTDPTLALVPPSLLVHDLEERRDLWGKQWKSRARTDVLIGQGPACVRCGQSTGVHERQSVSNVQVAARSFMLRWYACRECGLVHYPQQYRCWNVEPTNAEIAKMVNATGSSDDDDAEFVTTISDSYREHLCSVLQARRNYRDRQPLLFVRLDHEILRADDIARRNRQPEQGPYRVEGPTYCVWENGQRVHRNGRVIKDGFMWENDAWAWIDALDQDEVERAIGGPMPDDGADWFEKVNLATTDAVEVDDDEDEWRLRVVGSDEPPASEDTCHDADRR